MVKNTNGGKGAKGLARKLTNSYETYRLRTSSSPEEKYAIVSKMLGNGMCNIITSDNASLICHIRNKFRGRSKRGNLVTKDTIVLVGLREWEHPNYKNSDLLELYDNTDIRELKKMPDVKFSFLESLMTTNISIHDNTNDSIYFSNDVDPQVVMPTDMPIIHDDHDDEIIDIDDI
jgi:translation initiation factor IF-1